MRSKTRSKIPRLRKTYPVRVWTIQPAGILERLEAERILYVDPAHIPQEFRFAYDWMRTQMGRRIPGYGGHYPSGGAGRAPAPTCGSQATCRAAPAGCAWNWSSIQLRCCSPTSTPGISS